MELNIPKWPEWFMRHAYLASSKSKDTSTKFGAVLVQGKHVISEGYNGICQNVDDSLPDRLERPAKYLWFEHAERNSIFGCAYHGIKASGSYMYTQSIPCADCARAVIQAGIKKLIVHKEWEEKSGLFDNPKWMESCTLAEKMLSEAGIEIERFSGELGISTICNGKIFIV